MGVVVLLYAAAVATGATTSSIAVGHLQPGGTEDPHHWGDVQGIRSDEYNAFTPIQLSMLASGGAPTFGPLSADASLVHRYPVGPVQSVVFWDTLLLRLGPVLPHAQLFAAHWWLPTLLVLLCMPTWFVLMGGRRGIGWMTGVLVVAAPSNFWWSLQPTLLTAYVLAGCTAMLGAARRFERGQRLVPALQCAIGGVCIAGMPSNYFLWSLLLGGGILLASSLRLLMRWRRASLLALGLTGVIAAALGAGVILEGLPGLEALTSTTYPGQRRESAAALDAGMLFGAPALGALAHAEPQGTNASELSSALNLAILLIPMAWLAGPRLMRWRARAPEIALALWSGIWLAWAMVTIGNLGQRIPLASSVPPVRAAQAIGVVGVIALGLALSHVRRGARGIAVLAGGLAAGVTLYAGSLLRQGSLPGMSLDELWAAGLLTGGCVALLMAAPRRWYPPAIAATCALLVVITSSPLQFGLAGFRGNPAADYFADQGRSSRTEGTLWAADDTSASILMLANGVPTLTGLQRGGPDAEAWRALDPAGASESSWNRGGGYSNFIWAPGEPTQFADDGYDQVFTKIDPCTLAEAEPRLGHVVSGTPLEDSPCLTPETTLTWHGARLYVYTVTRAS